MVLGCHLFHYQSRHALLPRHRICLFHDKFTSPFIYNIQCNSQLKLQIYNWDHSYNLFIYLYFCHCLIGVATLAHTWLPLMIFICTKISCCSMWFIHLSLCAEGFQGSEDPCGTGHTNAESYFTGGHNCEKNHYYTLYNGYYWLMWSSFLNLSK